MYGIWDWFYRCWRWYKKDADAIAIRWKDKNDNYKIAVYDGGLQAHGDKMVEHLNEYYFSDLNDKIIDCVICSHSDLDHTSGLKHILEEFEVKSYIWIDRGCTLMMSGIQLMMDELQKQVFVKGWKTIQVY